MAVSTPTRRRRSATRQRQPERDLAAQTRKVFANLPPDVQELVRHAAGPSKPNGGAPQISADLVKKLAPDIRETLRKATAVATMRSAMLVMMRASSSCTWMRAPWSRKRPTAPK